MADVAARRSASPRTWVLLLLPTLLFVGLYARSLDYAFVWTDQAEIEHGVVILPPHRIAESFGRPMLSGLDSKLGGAPQPYYRPLQIAAVSGVDHVLGRVPRHFRSMNLLLGALTVLLFTLLAARLVGDPLRAGLAGGVFAAHPAGIENYVWISGLGQALVSAFAVLALLATWHALRARSAAGRASGALGSIAALVLGLLSKESGVAIPGMVIALVACMAVQLGRRGENPETGLPRSFERWAGPLVLAHVVVALAFMLAWRPAVMGRALSGAEPVLGSLPVHVLTALATWPANFVWLFFPVESTTSDVARIVRELLDPLAVCGVLLALGSAWLWVRWMRAGQAIPALGLAWVWIAFAPTSGLVPLTHMRADRYLSFSVLGVALLWSAAVPWLAERLPARRRAASTLALAGLVVFGLAQRSFVRVPDWRSDLVLFARDVERDPLYREAYFVLGNRLAESGAYEAAQARLIALLELGPRFAGRTSFLRVEATATLACRVNDALGDGATTLRLFGETLRAESRRPAAAPEFFVCGARALEQQGEVDEALAIYRAVHEADPLGTSPRVALGIARCLARRGEIKDARRWLARVERSGVPADARFQQELATLRELLRVQSAP